MSQDTLQPKRRHDPLEFVVAGAILGLSAYAVVDTVSRRARELLAHLGVRGTSFPPRMP